MAAKPLRTPAGERFEPKCHHSQSSHHTGSCLSRHRPPSWPPTRLRTEDDRLHWRFLCHLCPWQLLGSQSPTHAQRRWTQRRFRERALEGLSGWRDAHLVLPRAARPCANGGGHRAAILALEPRQISPEEKSKCLPRSSHHHMVPNFSLSGWHKVKSAPHSVPVP